VKTCESELRRLYQLHGHAQVVPAEQHELGEGGYVVEVALKMAPGGRQFVYGPLRWPESSAVRLWSDRGAALAWLADALEEL